MGGKEEQRAIINSELYWFGGLRDSQCHQAQQPEIDRNVTRDDATSNRHMHAWTDEEGKFHVQIDPVDGCLMGTVEIDVIPED